MEGCTTTTQNKQTVTHTSSSSHHHIPPIRQTPSHERNGCLSIVYQPMYTSTRHPHIHTRKDVLVLLSRIHPVHDDREMEWMDGSELFLSSFHVHGVLYVCFVLHDGELVRDGRPWCVCVCVYV